MKQPRQLSAHDALLRLAARCRTTECCEYDLRTALKRWGISAGDADAVIDRLRREGFINDERYVRAFVHDKVKFDGWGREKIRYTLRLKGLDGDVVSDALSAIDDDAYLAALRSLLQRRAREVAGREPALRRAALMRTAASRGYEAALASRVVSSILSSDDDEVDCYD